MAGLLTTMANYHWSLWWKVDLIALDCVMAFTLALSTAPLWTLVTPVLRRLTVITLREGFDSPTVVHISSDVSRIR